MSASLHQPTRSIGLRTGFAVMVLALGVPAAFAVAGSVPGSPAGPAARLARAASIASSLLAHYDRLYDSDLGQTIFPVVQGIAGRDADDAPAVCGMVVSGVSSTPDHVPVVVWQRAVGTCATSKVGRVQAQAILPDDAGVDGAALVVVEVLRRDSYAGAFGTGGGGYAAAVLVPGSGTLMPMVSGSRF